MYAQRLRDLAPARAGHGPLLQRDYWAVIDQCRLSPSQVIAFVARRFAEFAPQELVVFECDSSKTTLPVGTELSVRIRMAGTFRVRVVHASRCSLTLATLVAHPEAGRITFGAYRNEFDDVIFHIRSRARFGRGIHYIGYLLGADALQTNTWTEFVNRVAASTGNGALAYVHAETRQLKNLTSDDDPCSPTFIALGD
jgi:hypothetical protein